jgi:hypothetical protein
MVLMLSQLSLIDC